MLPPKNSVWSLPVNPTARFVMMAILSFDQMPEGAWPSIQTLAEWTGYCLRTVQRAIRDLEAASVIKVSQRRDQHGVCLSNSYTINHPVTAAGSPCISDGVTPSQLRGHPVTESPDNVLTTNNNWTVGPSALGCQSDTLPVHHPDPLAGKPSGQIPVPVVLGSAGQNSESADLESSGKMETLQGQLKQATEVVELFASKSGLSAGDRDRQSWFKTARIMQTSDHHPFDEVCRLITWVCADQEWSKLIPGLYEFRQFYKEIKKDANTREPKLSTEARISADYNLMNSPGNEELKAERQRQVDESNLKSVERFRLISGSA